MLEESTLHPSGKIHEIFKGKNTVGRNDGRNVVLDSEFVSGEHPNIFVRDDGVFYQDQSTNGTIVDGQEIKQKGVPLHSGSILTFPGTSNMRLYVLFVSTGTDDS